MTGLTGRERLTLLQLSREERIRLAPCCIQGYTAAEASKSLEANPHPATSLESLSWQAGWHDYFRENS